MGLETEVKGYAGVKVEEFTGENPFKPETKNLTLQCAMISQNKPLAEFCKQQAGIKINFQDFQGSNPYEAKSLSVKIQSELERTDPELASLLKAQANGAKIGKITSVKTGEDIYYEILEGGQY